MSPNPNQDRLNKFVADRLADGRPEHLLANAEKLRGMLRELSEATKRDRPAPAHLKGLTAFDLSDAADRLEAAASAQKAA